MPTDQTPCPCSPPIVFALHPLLSLRSLPLASWLTGKLVHLVLVVFVAVSVFRYECAGLGVACTPSATTDEPLRPRTGPRSTTDPCTLTFDEPASADDRRALPGVATNLHLMSIFLRDRSSTPAPREALAGPAHLESNLAQVSQCSEDGRHLGHKRGTSGRRRTRPST